MNIASGTQEETSSKMLVDLDTVSGIDLLWAKFMKTTSVSILLSIATISGCSMFRGPPGPKLYDNAFAVVKSDATVVTSQAEENDILRIAHLRLSEFTSDELAARGDLKAVQTCGPRTLKITEDIQSISTESAIRLKHNFFGTHTTGEQHEDFRVSINTIVEDCETGKRLESFTYDNHGIDLVAVLKTLASWNVSEAYRYQHGPRPLPKLIASISKS